uniref:Methyltransferase type 11 domain-containing protein n=1 Tax=Daucus carota subsp. sativus TaxID=79200 RepID=A0A161ZX98_DAUCS
MSRPELQAPPEIFYDDTEARKYTSSSRIMEIQAQLSERAIELLALPDDDVPRLLLDIGCGSGLSGETLSEYGHQWIGLDISESMLNIAREREVEGDLILGDMGQGLGLRPGVIDGAISISAVQWLCNADKSSHEPRLRLKAFFGCLYRCLARGARAVLQVYPENIAQRELILSFAMRAGFAGGVVVDYPHSSKSRKEYLVLTCGPPSLSSATPKAKGEDGESCSEDDSSADEENPTVCISDRHRPRKKQKVNKKGKGRNWVLKKKEQMRKKGNVVPPDTKHGNGMDEQEGKMLTLVARKACFGLPTACPSFQIPYVETGECYVAYNNENGGVIDTLKQDGIADLDSGLDAIPEWISMKAMITSWLADAVMYELWMGSDGTSARKIYYSDLPWPISKFLYYKQIYRKATKAYEALSARLGEDLYFFESRPTSLDALLLGHVLFTLHALPETSDLRSKLLSHTNLVKSADCFMSNYVNTSNSTSGLQSGDPLSSGSEFQSYQSTSKFGGGSSNWRSNPRSKPKREKTEEEKTFRRRAKYFLVTQLAAVLIFLSLIGGSENVDMELDNDDDGSIYG